MTGHDSDVPDTPSMRDFFARRGLDALGRPIEKAQAQKVIPPVTTGDADGDAGAGESVDGTPKAPTAIPKVDTFTPDKRSNRIQPTDEVGRKGALKDLGQETKVLTPEFTQGDKDFDAHSTRWREGGYNRDKAIELANARVDRKKQIREAMDPHRNQVLENMEGGLEGVEFSMPLEGRDDLSQRLLNKESYDKMVSEIDSSDMEDDQKNALKQQLETARNMELEYFVYGDEEAEDEATVNMIPGNEVGNRSWVLGVDQDQTVQVPTDQARAILGRVTDKGADAKAIVSEVTGKQGGSPQLTAAMLQQARENFERNPLPGVTPEKYEEAITHISSKRRDLKAAVIEGLMPNAKDFVPDLLDEMPEEKKNALLDGLVKDELARKLDEGIYTQAQIDSILSQDGAMETLRNNMIENPSQGLMNEAAKAKASKMMEDVDRYGAAFDAVREGYSEKGADGEVLRNELKGYVDPSNDLTIQSMKASITSNAWPLAEVIARGVTALSDVTETVFRGAKKFAEAVMSGNPMSIAMVSVTNAMYAANAVQRDIGSIYARYGYDPKNPQGSMSAFLRSMMNGEVNSRMKGAREASEDISDSIETYAGGESDLNRMTVDQVESVFYDLASKYKRTNERLADHYDGTDRLKPDELASLLAKQKSLGSALEQIQGHAKRGTEEMRRLRTQFNIINAYTQAKMGEESRKKKLRTQEAISRSYDGDVPDFVGWLVDQNNGELIALSGDKLPTQITAAITKVTSEIQHLNDKKAAANPEDPFTSEDEARLKMLSTGLKAMEQAKEKRRQILQNVRITNAMLKDSPTLMVLFQELFGQDTYMSKLNPDGTMRINDARKLQSGAAWSIMNSQAQELRKAGKEPMDDDSYVASYNLLRFVELDLKLYALEQAIDSDHKDKYIGITLSDLHDRRNALLEKAPVNGERVAELKAMGVLENGETILDLKEFEELDDEISDRMSKAKLTPEELDKALGVSAMYDMNIVTGNRTTIKPRVLGKESKNKLSAWYRKSDSRSHGSVTSKRFGSNERADAKTAMLSVDPHNLSFAEKGDQEKIKRAMRINAEAMGLDIDNPKTHEDQVARAIYLARPNLLIYQDLFAYLDKGRRYGISMDDLLQRNNPDILDKYDDDQKRNFRSALSDLELMLYRKGQGMDYLLKDYHDIMAIGATCNGSLPLANKYAQFAKELTGWVKHTVEKEEAKRDAERGGGGGGDDEPPGDGDDNNNNSDIEGNWLKIPFKDGMNADVVKNLNDRFYDLDRGDLEQNLDALGLDDADKKRILDMHDLYNGDLNTFRAGVANLDKDVRDTMVERYAQKHLENILDGFNKGASDEAEFLRMYADPLFEGHRDKIIEKFNDVSQFASYESDMDALIQAAEAKDGQGIELARKGLTEGTGGTLKDNLNKMVTEVAQRYDPNYKEPQKATSPTKVNPIQPPIQPPTRAAWKTDDLFLNKEFEKKIEDLESELDKVMNNPNPSDDALKPIKDIIKDLNATWGQHDDDKARVRDIIEEALTQKGLGPAFMARVYPSTPSPITPITPIIPLTQTKTWENDDFYLNAMNTRGTISAKNVIDSLVSKLNELNELSGKTELTYKDVENALFYLDYIRMIGRMNKISDKKNRLRDANRIINTILKEYPDVDLYGAKVEEPIQDILNQGLDAQASMDDIVKKIKYKYRKELGSGNNVRYGFLLSGKSDIYNEFAVMRKALQERVNKGEEDMEIPINNYLACRIGALMRKSNGKLNWPVILGAYTDPLARYGNIPGILDKEYGLGKYKIPKTMDEFVKAQWALEDELSKDGLTKDDVKRIRSEVEELYGRGLDMFGEKIWSDAPWFNDIREILSKPINERLEKAEERFKEPEPTVPPVKTEKVKTSLETSPRDTEGKKKGEGTGKIGRPVTVERGGRVDPLNMDRSDYSNNAYWNKIKAINEKIEDENHWIKVKDTKSKGPMLKSIYYIDWDAEKKKAGDNGRKHVADLFKTLLDHDDIKAAIDTNLKGHLSAKKNETISDLMKLDYSNEEHKERIKSILTKLGGKNSNSLIKEVFIPSNRGGQNDVLNDIYGDEVLLHKLWNVLQSKYMPQEGSTGNGKGLGTGKLLDPEAVEGLKKEKKAKKEQEKVEEKRQDKENPEVKDQKKKKFPIVMVPDHFVKDPEGAPVEDQPYGSVSDDANGLKSTIDNAYDGINKMYGLKFDGKRAGFVKELVEKGNHDAVVKLFREILRSGTAYSMATKATYDREYRAFCKEKGGDTQDPVMKEAFAKEMLPELNKKVTANDLFNSRDVIIGDILGFGSSKKKSATLNKVKDAIFRDQELVERLAQSVRNTSPPKSKTEEEETGINKSVSFRDMVFKSTSHDVVERSKADQSTFRGFLNRLMGRGA